MSQRNTLTTKALHFGAATRIAALGGMILLAGFAFAHGGMEHFVGAVAAVANQTLTVKTTSGQTVEVALDAKTQYFRGDQPAKLGDLKPGARVVVHATKANGHLVATTVKFSASGGPKSKAGHPEGHGHP